VASDEVASEVTPNRYVLKNLIICKT